MRIRLRKKTKRILSTLLLLVLVSVLSVCFGKQESDPDSSKAADASFPPYESGKGEVRLVVKKAERRLEVWQGETLVVTFPVGLGKDPVGHKQREGDNKTPEGEYYVCVKNRNSRYYLSLGVSYPNKEDAAAALQDGRIDRQTYERIARAIDKGGRPDWYTALGGEIMIHGHGSASDWTRGCIAVENEVMDMLFAWCSLGTRITILP